MMTRGNSITERISVEESFEIVSGTRKEVHEKLNSDASLRRMTSKNAVWRSTKYDFMEVACVKSKIKLSQI